MNNSKVLVETKIERHGQNPKGTCMKHHEEASEELSAAPLAAGNLLTRHVVFIEQEDDASCPSDHERKRRTRGRALQQADKTINSNKWMDNNNDAAPGPVCRVWEEPGRHGRRVT